jgi:hypothetical protein
MGETFGQRRAPGQIVRELGTKTTIRHQRIIAFAWEKQKQGLLKLLAATNLIC